MENQITTTLLSTRAIKAAVSREGCRLDTLLQLTTPPPERVAVKRRPATISLVIDRSGSMAGGKLEAACSAAQHLVRQLTPADRVAVISFDLSIRMVVPLMAPDAAVIKRIAEIRSGGQTALFDGWSAGVNLLLEAPGLERNQKRVLLLTDGQANLGVCRRSQVARWVGQARERAIHTSCIGHGDTYAEGLLSVMAETGDGNLLHLTSPEQLVAVFTLELEGLSLRIGRDLRLRLAVDPGCRLRRIQNPIEPDANGLIRLGLLQADGGPSLAIQLEVAPEAGGIKLCNLLQVQARWLDGYGKPQNPAGVLRLPLVSGEHWQSLPVDEEVQTEVLLQRVARQRRAAVHVIDSGVIETTRCSVQAALFSMANAKSSPDVAQERELLSELLNLIATNKLSLARKGMGTKAFMSTSGRKLRDRD